MNGLRAYDVFMAGSLVPGHGEVIGGLQEYKEKSRGVPVFLIEDVPACYKSTVDAKGQNGAMHFGLFPSIVIPFRRFVMEWESQGDPPELWQRQCAVCTWYPVHRILDIDVWACSFVAGVPMIFMESQFHVPVSEEWCIGSAKVWFSPLLSAGIESGLINPGVSGGITIFALGMLAAKNVSRHEGRIPRMMRRHPGQFASTANDVHYVLDIPGAKEFRKAVAAAEGSAKRLHIVRGHFSDYTEGGGLFGKLHGKYYIAPHVRGDASLGTIAKDYRLKVNAA